MLRILLIILVALAVIIGLMRLTGAKPGDAAPAPAVGAAEPVEEAVGAGPAGEVIVDEPAVDALDVPVDLDVDAPVETTEPGVATTEPGVATTEPEADNAAEPTPEPAPEPAPETQAPGR